MEELKIISKISHPYIQSVNEVMHDDKKFYTSAEYCEGGELFQRLS